MWRILETEFLYSKRLILGLLLLVLVITIQQIWPFVADLSASYLLFILCFLAMQNWTVYKNREHRDNLMTRLPVSSYILALVRILMLLLIWILFWGVFVLLCIVSSAELDLKSAMISIAVLITGFSIYYMIRDHLYQFFRVLGITAQKILFSVALLILGLNILGIFFFIRTSATGSPPVSLRFLTQFARYFKYADVAETVKITAVGTLFALLSLASYLKKNSHLE